MLGLLFYRIFLIRTWKIIKEGHSKMDPIETIKAITQISTEDAKAILECTQGDVDLSLSLYYELNGFPAPVIPPQLFFQVKVTQDSAQTSARLETSKVTNWVEYSYEEVEKIAEKQHKEGYLSEKENERCTICLCDFEPSDNGEIIKLGRCGEHFYHKGCIENCRGESDSVRCPVCGAIYGVMMGDMPPGTMTVIRIENFMPLDGYDNCATFQINYEFPNGTRNGKRYRGTARVAFLPDNPEGNEVLRLLQIAFERKLTFTIGRSVTTGRDNCVIWNGIHHKTSPDGGPPNFGYPDETYFTRVKEELAAKGIY
ncbi:unnamed protein product [Blepharisma stoltei]|uniref:RING-type E3 ubiquitin transferase n=1 Tax=Blepharisma stoltei TaxID=1481888 RepID=A0AAU9IW75_9CILI|nr:unnamed protein product [Blepharisma stoltei]